MKWMHVTEVDITEFMFEKSFNHSRWLWLRQKVRLKGLKHESQSRRSHTLRRTDHPTRDIQHNEKSGNGGTGILIAKCICIVSPIVRYVINKNYQRTNWGLNHCTVINCVTISTSLSAATQLQVGRQSQSVRHYARPAGFRKSGEV